MPSETLFSTFLINMYSYSFTKSITRKKDEVLLENTKHKANYREDDLIKDLTNAFDKI